MTSNPQGASGAMSTTTQQGTATTVTQTQTEQVSIPSNLVSSGVLVLRAAERGERRHIQWAEDVVDNEGMGKKSSKVCCIYHKPHAVDESSSSEGDSSDSSSDDSDSEIDDGRARPIGGGNNNPRRSRARRKHDHNHEHEEGAGGEGSGKGKARKPSPNAYEKMPKSNNKPQKNQNGQ